MIERIAKILINTEVMIKNAVPRIVAMQMVVTMHFFKVIDKCPAKVVPRNKPRSIKIQMKNSYCKEIIGKNIEHQRKINRINTKFAVSPIHIQAKIRKKERKYNSTCDFSFFIF